MRPAQLEKLRIAAELSLQREMAQLGEVERQRRLLREQADRLEVATRVDSSAADGDAIGGHDLLFADRARMAARQHLSKCRNLLTGLDQGPRAIARDRVRKALAKKSVIDDLIDQSRQSRRETA